MSSPVTVNRKLSLKTAKKPATFPLVSSFAWIACLFLLPMIARSQDTNIAKQASSGPVSEAGTARGLSLQDAVQKALTSYPTVRIALEKTLSARAGVGLTRTQYLPQAGVLWQTNRSTYNNIAGLVMPQAIVPSLSGTVLADTSGTSVWGSAAGLLMNWEPTRFGYRKAEMDAANAGANAAADRLTLTRLDVANAAASAYIVVAEAHEEVRSARADLARRQTFAETIHTLVDNQLRPGADASQADAEVAAAKIRLIRSQTAEKTDFAGLAELLVMHSSQLQISSDALLTLPAEEVFPSFAADHHPLALEANHLWSQSKAEERVWSRAYAPRIGLEGSVSGRGSGVKPDGTLLEGTNGLAPDRGNWAVGIQATFAPFDYFAIREQKKIAAANERAQQLNFQNTLEVINSQVEQARAQFDGAIEIAHNTPIQLAAAQAAETQARARYQAGLANIVEATRAQALLEQAEAEDALARIGVWQALLQVYAAQGDIDPLLSSLPKSNGGGH